MSDSNVMQMINELFHQRSGSIKFFDGGDHVQVCVTDDDGDTSRYDSDAGASPSECLADALSEAVRDLANADD